MTPSQLLDSIGLSPAVSLAVLIAIVGLSVLRFVYFAPSSKQDVQRLGARPPPVPSWAPFHLDLAIKAVNALRTHTFTNLLEGFMSKSPGKTVEFQNGSNYMILTRHPANVRAMMSSQFDEFNKGDVVKSILNNLMGNGAIFVTDGKAWHEKKELLRPHFALPRDSDLDVTEEHFQALLRRLNSSNGPGQTPAVEVYDLIDRYQLDIVSHIFFGKSAGTLASDKTPFREAMDRILMVITFKALFGYVGSLVPDEVFASNELKEINRYVESLMTMAYSSEKRLLKGDAPTLLEDLASRGFGFVEFKEQVIAVMLAAKDPTAITAAWIVFELARNPVVLEKLRREILDIGLGFEQRPTTDHLRQLTYLGHIVNEGLRMYHPLGLNIKTAKRDVCLPTGGGPAGNEPVYVPEGTQVLYSTFSLQRAPENWGPNSNEFVPERWVDMDNVDRWHFIPFNHGPRICLGRNFGLQQLEYFLVRLAQNFEQIRLDTEFPAPKVKLELNTKMAGPIMCEFIREGGI